MERSQIKEYIIKIQNSPQEQSPCPDIKKDLRIIKSFCKKAMSDKLPYSSSGSKWICDNYYVIEREGKNLLKIASKALPAHSRLYVYVEKTLFFTDYVLDNDITDCFFNVFSRNDFLTDKEINNVQNVMKAVIINRIAILCGELKKSVGFKLRDAEKTLSDTALAKNLIVSLRKIPGIDFSSYVMGYSPIERMFRCDPAGIYHKMDKQTQLLYREMLEKKAKKQHKTPQKLLEELLKKCAAEKDIKRHVGYYLFDNPRGAGYLSTLSVVYILMIGITALFSGRYTLPVLILSAIPVFEASSALANRLCALMKKPRIIPKLKFDSPFGVPDDCKTLTVITTILFGGEHDRALFERLEKFYLCNKDKNLLFGILCDLKESDTEHDKNDNKIISDAQKAIDGLNKKYGSSFFLFVRERVYSQTQNCYMGYERKRGAVIELCRFIKGINTSVKYFSGSRNALEGIKYIVTLDSDTDMGIGQLSQLCGAMAHPLNSPVIDCKGGRFYVKSGYGILQPRMSYGLVPAGKTSFCVLKSGAGGKDVYSGASFDIYQSFFGNGMFCGKGIFDIDAFLKVIDGAFPDGRILSHDILEGCLLRCGLIGEVVLTDSLPQNPISYFKREHRWMRGDIQAMAFAKNPLGSLSKFKLWCNITRLTAPIFAVLSIIFSLVLQTDACFGVALYLAVPFLWDCTGIIFSGNLQQIFRKFTSDVISGIWSAFLNLFYDASTLFHRGFLSIDAVIRSLWRMAVSKKNLLEWTTASEADSIKSGNIFGYIFYMKYSIVFGVISLLISNSPFVRFLGLLFIICPFASYLLSKPIEFSAAISQERLETIKNYCRDMWKFFEDNVNVTQNHLPPDNIQFSPVYAAAQRCSPTNIGLYLLSVLTARDFGFIDNDTLYRRISDTLGTVEKLEKWHGHLYNWYDNRTLEIIGTKYVSTVDSGNFITCLTALAKGLEEYASLDGRLNLLIERINKISDNTDLRQLYNSQRDLFYLGRNTEDNNINEGCYDLYMSEFRTTGYFAVARGDVPKKHWTSLGRILISRGFYLGAASWTGTTFEYFMPALLLPVYKNSFAQETLEFARHEQKRYSAAANGIKVWGSSECGFYAFDQQMNYQYKAIGVPFLSLKHEESEEKVISPYSSFLMLRKRSNDAEINLQNLKKLGMYGKYGFYEAIDFTPSRTETDFAVVESYMAHHVGMSIVACANFSFDNIFRKRFMADMRMASACELLEEKIPTDANIFRDINTDDMPERRTPSAPGIKSESIDEALPRIALFSGYRTTLRLSDCGHVWFERKGERRTRCITLLPSTVSSRKPCFAVGVKINDKIYSNIKRLCPDNAKVTFEYDRDNASYNITQNTRLVNINWRLSAFTGAVYIDITASLKESETSEYMLFLEPVLNALEDYKSHPAFSQLSFESEYDKENRILLIHKRSRKAGDELFLAVGVCDPDINISFETMADNLYTHGEEIEEIFADKSELSCTVGACISPGIFLKTEKSPVKKGRRSEKMCFIVLCASTRDGAVKSFLKARENYNSRHESEALAVANTKKNALASAENMDNNDYMLLERILRAVSFEKNIQIRESFDKDLFRREDIWQYSVSGDLPVIAVKADEKSLEFCGKMIMLHRLCTLKGLSFDLVFLFEDVQIYSRPIHNGLSALVSRYGSDYLINKKGGIFFIGDKNAHKIFYCCACDIFEDSRSEIIPDLPASFPKTVTSPVPHKTSLPDVIYSTFGGDFIQNGFVVDKIDKKPPLAYSHVLSNRIFGSVVTHKSLGYTWFSNSHERRLSHFENTPYTPYSSETIYLCDGDTLYDLCRISATVVFSAGGAKYTGTAAGCNFTISVSLHPKLPVKCVDISLSRPKKIFYSLKPVLGSSEGSTKGIYTLKTSGGLAFCSPFAKDSGFLTVDNKNTPLYATSVFEMTGQNSPVHDTVCVGCESEKATFFLCSFFSEKTLKYTVSSIHALSFDDIQRIQLDFVMDTMKNLTAVQCGENPVKMLNSFWIPYQAVFCRFFARSALYQSGGAFGFRDQLQDIRIFFNTNPRIARQHIIRCCAHQFEEGDVQHWWHNVKAPDKFNPGIRSRCSDDYLWLVLCACEYAETTDDYSVFDVEIKYLSDKPLSDKEHERYSTPSVSEIKESVYLHCKRACDLFIQRGLGAHGMPFIGSCDWNDGFSAVGEKGKGESVWLGFFGRIVLEKFALVVKLKGDDPLPYTQFSDLIGKNTDLYAYKNNRYLRGFYDDGSPLGDESCDECKIDILPQAFAALCDKMLGKIRPHAYRNPPEHIAAALESAYSSLYDKNNRILKLFFPAFDKSEKNPGYIKSYAPGLRENGGQYTHGAIWGAMGFLHGNQKDRAIEITNALCPPLRAKNKELFEKYKTEPYVLCGDVYSNISHSGRGGWSWYTGSASWYRELYEEIEKDV
ncbi:MAG: hypothetical protein IJO74_04300 [Clostridia bacterium]|nr:hypothetical protein [Clostridia bacterium]